MRRDTRGFPEEAEHLFQMGTATHVRGKVIE